MAISLQFLLRLNGLSSTRAGLVPGRNGGPRGFFTDVWKRGWFERLPAFAYALTFALQGPHRLLPARGHAFDDREMEVFLKLV